jgi:hypothetical protein
MLRCVAGEWLSNETCAELVAAGVLSAVRLDADAAAAPLAGAVRRAAEAREPGSGARRWQRPAPVSVSPAGRPSTASSNATAGAAPCRSAHLPGTPPRGLPIA